MQNQAILIKVLQKFSPKTVVASDQQVTKRLTSGYTLIEVLVVVVMVGILAAIAAPSWLAFVNRQRMNTANDAVLRALQEAQQEAKKRKQNYSFSARTDPTTNIPQIAVYSGSTPTNWRNLGGDLGIKPGQIVVGTNLNGTNTTSSQTAYGSTTAQSVTFDYLGALDLPLKTQTQAVQDARLGSKGLIVAVAVAQTGNPTRETGVKRCVIVRTILGSMRVGRGAECN